MRIVVIGATGTIGTALAATLERGGHDVVRASRGGPVTVDLAKPASIDALSDDYSPGLEGKMLGQVHLARRAAQHIKDGGSLTLTNGISTFSEPGLLRRPGERGPGPLRAGGGGDAAGHPAEPVADVVRAYVGLIEGAGRGLVVEPGATAAK